MEVEGDEDTCRQVVVTMTHDEALRLFEFFQSDECPNYWETPLAPLGAAMKEHHKRCWM